MHNVSKTIMNPSYSWWLVWTHFWWNWGWFTISSLSFGRHSQNMGCVATNQGKFELMEKDCWVPGNRSGASGPIGPIYPVLSCLGFQKVIEYHSQPKLLVSLTSLHRFIQESYCNRWNTVPSYWRKCMVSGHVIVGLYGGVLKWGYPQLIQNSCNLPFSDTLISHHISMFFSKKYLRFALGFSGLSDLAGECAASHTVTGMGWGSWEEPLRYGAQLSMGIPQ